METDECIANCSRDYQAQVALVRELQLEIDAKQAEVAALRTKIAAANVQLKDKRKALKDSLNGS